MLFEIHVYGEGFLIVGQVPERPFADAVNQIEPSGATVIPPESGVPTSTVDVLPEGVILSIFVPQSGETTMHRRDP
jgi:hypothetical protein